MIRVPSAGAQLRNWFYGYAAPERGTITLGHRRVYILPTRLGWMFGATLGILLVGSINYALQLGFALTFLLAGMGLAGMVHTVRNLARPTSATTPPASRSPTNNSPPCPSPPTTSTATGTTPSSSNRQSEAIVPEQILRDEQ